MKIYIHKYCTISVLNSFENGFLSEFEKDYSKKLIEPDYSKLIPESLLRRMSKVIRMGVGAAVGVMHDSITDGIIVGSGIGCYDNSLKFSSNYLHKREGALSPTAFIQSTDNAIAGQIAIVLKNNSYNNTYIHKGLAFENALVDALLLSNENKCKVLVGGVDEWISEFEFLPDAATNSDYWIGEGASFFLIDSEKENAKAEINFSWIISGNIENLENNISAHLKENELDLPDLILYGNSFINQRPITTALFGIETFNYSNVCGIYFTNSAFALQLATEILSETNQTKTNFSSAKKILIVNNFNDVDFGLTYLSKI